MAVAADFVTLHVLEGILEPIRSHVRSLEAQILALTANLSSSKHSSVAPFHIHIDQELVEKKCASFTQSIPQILDHLPSVFSYEDAFQITGGDESVQMCSPISRAVQEQIGDRELMEELRELFPTNCSRRGFSTTMVNQPFVSNVDELFAAAQRTLPKFQVWVESVAQSTHGFALIPPLKSTDRARAKSAFKYSDSTGVAWYRLTDLVRGTIVYSSIASMYEGLQEIAQNCQIREFNDRYADVLPGGYRDLQLVVQIQDHLCELQLNTVLMLRAKEVSGHRDYELIRELKAAIAAQDLRMCQQAFGWAQAHLGSSRQQNFLNTPEGATLLHSACVVGHADIVVCFLEQKCDPNAQDENGNTGLHLAMREGHERTVWALLNKADNIDVTITNNAKQTALLLGYLSFHVHPEERRARALSTLAHAAGVHHVRSTRCRVADEVKLRRHNSSHLVDFAREGRIEEMTVELQKFADPNSKRDGVPALIAAVHEQQTKSIELLLKYGVNQEIYEDAVALACQKVEWSLIDALFAVYLPCSAAVLKKVAIAAAQNGKLTSLELIMRRKPRESDHDEILLAAISASVWKAVELLLTFRPRANTQRKLMIAASQVRQMKVLQLLSTLGPDMAIHTQVINQELAHGQWECIEALVLIKPVPPTLRNLMAEAARQDQAKCIESILRHEVEEEIREEAIVVALNASPGPAWKIITLLLTFRPNLKIQVELMKKAAVYGHDECLGLLFALGADSELASQISDHLIAPDGQIPVNWHAIENLLLWKLSGTVAAKILDKAVKFGRLTCLSKLLKNLPAVDCYPAFSQALEGGQLEAARLLRPHIPNFKLDALLTNCARAKSWTAANLLLLKIFEPPAELLEELLISATTALKLEFIEVLLLHHPSPAAQERAIYSLPFSYPPGSSCVQASPAQGIFVLFAEKVTCHTFSCRAFHPKFISLLGQGICLSASLRTLDLGRGDFLGTLGREELKSFASVVAISKLTTLTACETTIPVSALRQRLPCEFVLTPYRVPRLLVAQLLGTFNITLSAKSKLGDKNLSGFEQLEALPITTEWLLCFGGDDS